MSRAAWEPRAAAHRARLAPYVEPHLERRRTGDPHPVHDFLFTYYSHRPAQLLLWHPGLGVRLEDAPEHEALAAYQDGAVTAELLERRRPIAEAVRRLLVATLGRPANLGCFGLHEWAMVYGADRGPGSPQTRHPLPLRLGTTGTDAVVEGHRIACTHFDAYRFFTEPARPLNTLSPGRDDRPAFEQPGCLHASMDLYKHAFRLSPLLPSDLVADCFELAWDIRVLDMRAAPYDMSGWTLDPTGEPWTPVPIETAEGKREYAEQQRVFSERAEPIRRRLLAECERLLAWDGTP